MPLRVPPLPPLPFPHLRRFSSRYVAPRWRWYVAGTAAVLLTNWMAVRIPVELAFGLDALRAGDSQSPVTTAAVHIFALGAAIIVVRTASRLWFFTPARLAEFDLREDLFARLLRLQPDFYATHRTGDLLSRATTDITFARAFAGFATLQGANIVAALVTALGQMAAFSPLLTVITAIPVLLGFVVVRGGSAALMTIQRTTQKQQGLYADELLGALQGISTIQAFNVEGPFGERLAERARLLRDNNIQLARLRALVFPLFTVSGGIAVFMLLGVGGSMVVDGEMTAGQLAAFISLVTYLIIPLRLLGFLLPVFHRAETSLERIHEMFDAPVSRPELDAPPSTLGDPPRSGQPPAIVLKNLSFSFGAPEGSAPDVRGAAPVLRDVTVEIPAGTSLGVFGRSGSGKTTLLRLLARLENPPAGSITVDGVDLCAIDLDQWRARMVLVPQTAWLFSETIAENVAMGLQADLKQADLKQADLKQADLLPSAIADAALGPDLEALPHGLGTVVGERGIVLSGGQRQRVALARGLVYARSGLGAAPGRGAGKLLLFDDVLSAVDHHTEQLLIHTLLGSREDVRPTCVIVTHRMSALQHCDRVLVLDAGRAVQYGTHVELLAQPGIYRDAWDTQAGTT
ncbi:MAG: ABC transporter ATP-binding protein [Myxococcales bacterium]|nr:ABC transporter ATP-binding protein [Myxococcales bacterium]